MIQRKLNGIKGVALFSVFFIGFSLMSALGWSMVFSIVFAHNDFLDILLPLGLVLGVAITSIGMLFEGFLKNILFSYIEEEDIGELDISSGGMLICDPFFLRKIPEGTIELDGLNKGKFPAKITLKHVGKIKRIVKAELGIFDAQGEKRLLGQIPVLSNSVCIVDKQNFKDNFLFRGVERIGMIYAKNHKEIAEKIKNKLELDYIEDSEMTSKFLETISENLERGIRTFLNQKEKEAFFIWTNNTYDQISKKLGEKYKPDYTYTDCQLDENQEGNILVFSTTKDRLHKVYGIFDNEQLTKIIIEIG